MSAIVTVAPVSTRYLTSSLPTAPAPCTATVRPCGRGLPSSIRKLGGSVFVGHPTSQPHCIPESIRLGFIRPHTHAARRRSKSGIVNNNDSFESESFFLAEKDVLVIICFHEVENKVVHCPILLETVSKYFFIMSLRSVMSLRHGSNELDSASSIRKVQPCHPERSEGSRCWKWQRMSGFCVVCYAGVRGKRSHEL